MKKYKRIFTVVIDSLGAGAMPDASEYGDAGTDTLGHISQSVDGFNIPNLQRLGIDIAAAEQMGMGLNPILVIAKQ